MRGALEAVTLVGDLIRIIDGISPGNKGNIRIRGI